MRLRVVGGDARRGTLIAMPTDARIVPLSYGFAVGYSPVALLCRGWPQEMWTKKSTVDKVKEIWRFWLPCGLTDAAAIGVCAVFLDRRTAFRIKTLSRSSISRCSNYQQFDPCAIERGRLGF
jgi:hypothetical protein